MLKQLNIESILAWKPCYHPSRHLPENWTGTIINLLDNKDIPHADRIWLATKYLPLRDIQEFTIWCARQAFKSKGVEVNKASRNAVDVAELYLCGNASLDELIEAKNAAYVVYTNAANAANANAAYANAAYAAYAAAYANANAAYANAAYAAYAAAYANANAAYAAYAAAYANAAIREKQIEYLKQVCLRGK